LDTACNIINHKVLIEGLKHDQLLRENEILEEAKSKNSQRLQELELLEKKSFGLAEFKMLHNLINEIAAIRGMPTDDNTAVKILFDDLRDHFYDYLNLAKKLQQIKLELRNLCENRDMIITQQLTTSSIKGNSSNKNFANSNEAVNTVRANEGKSQEGLDSAAMFDNDSEKIRLTQGTERKKSVCNARNGLKPPRSNLVYGGLMHKRDALDRNVLKGGASNRINNQGAFPRTGNEKQLSESASEDLKQDTPERKKHEDITNPHQLYGGNDQEEFYGTNILDSLAYLHRKYKTSTSPNHKVGLNDAYSDYSQRKVKDVKGHSGFGPIGKDKRESEDPIC
jgi:hypothetical protein